VMENDVSAECLQSVHEALLQDQRRAAANAGSWARTVAKLVLLVIISPLALPWWAVWCWWDLRTEDRDRAERAGRPRVAVASLPIGRGEVRIAERNAARATTLRRN
jgi:hypothetical protein